MPEQGSDIDVDQGAAQVGVVDREHRNGAGRQPETADPQLAFRDDLSGICRSHDLTVELLRQKGAGAFGFGGTVCARAKAREVSRERFGTTGIEATRVVRLGREARGPRADREGDHHGKPGEREQLSPRKEPIQVEALRPRGEGVPEQVGREHRTEECAARKQHCGEIAVEAHDRPRRREHARPVRDHRGDDRVATAVVVDDHRAADEDVEQRELRHQQQHRSYLEGSGRQQRRGYVRKEVAEEQPLIAKAQTAGALHERSRAL